MQGRSSDLGSTEATPSLRKANGIRCFVHLTALGTLRNQTAFPILQLALAPCNCDGSSGIESKQVLKKLATIWNGLTWPDEDNATSLVRKTKC